MRERVVWRLSADTSPFLGTGPFQKSIGRKRLAQKPGDAKVRLWFDKNVKDIAPYIFTCFEPGAIPMTRRTKYTQYNDLFADFSVKVPVTSKLIGRNHPVWKVTVIPDAVDFYGQFAVVVSMSHIVGDGHTYYKLFHMLSAQNPVQSMNPCRRQDFPAQMEAHMGAEEAFYLKKTNPDLVNETLKTAASPAQKAPRRAEEGGSDRETLLFTVSKTWLEDQMRETADDAGIASVSQSDVILSWWFKTSNADIGLYPHQFRQQLPILNSLDAGNYNNPIPFTRDDYSTPQQIHGALEAGRRSGSSLSGAPLAPLPHVSTGKSLSIGVDWNRLSPKGTVPDEEGIVEDLHIPLFSVADLHTIPSKMAVLIMFTAVARRNDDGDSCPQIGVFVVASKEICERVAQSGVIDSNLTTSLTSNLTNRRGSIIDFGAQRPSFTAAGLEVMLSDDDLAILSIEDDEEGEADEGNIT